MTVISLYFLFFAFAAALIYHRLSEKYRNLWLLLVSVGFLISWSWQFVLVLLVFGLVNYALGLQIAKPDARKNNWVVFGILLNLATLFVFKYSNFYLPALTSLLDQAGIHLTDGIKILLPVGLSFLVVQAISYLVDVKNNRLAAEKDPVKFGVYILYFPKLLSGPVERAR